MAHIGKVRLNPIPDCVTCSRLLTLLVSDIANPFYPQLAKSVEQEAKQAGFAVVICNTKIGLPRLVGMSRDS